MGAGRNVGQLGQVLAVGGREHGVMINRALRAARYCPVQGCARECRRQVHAVINAALNCAPFFIIIPGYDLQGGQLIARRIELADIAEGIKPGLATALRNLPIGAPAGDGIVKAFVDRTQSDPSALPREGVEVFLRRKARIGRVVARRNVNPCVAAVGIVLLQAFAPAEEQHRIGRDGGQHPRPINVVAAHAEHEDRQLAIHPHVGRRSKIVRDDVFEVGDELVSHIAAVLTRGGEQCAGIFSNTKLESLMGLCFLFQ